MIVLSVQHVVGCTKKCIKESFLKEILLKIDNSREYIEMNDEGYPLFPNVTISHRDYIYWILYLSVYSINVSYLSSIWKPNSYTIFENIVRAICAEKMVAGSSRIVEIILYHLWKSCPDPYGLGTKIAVWSYQKIVRKHLKAWSPYSISVYIEADICRKIGAGVQSNSGDPSNHWSKSL